MIVIFVFVFSLIFQTTCYAWLPSSEINCSVDYSSIPENTAYIDLLLPMDTLDQNYTAFNEQNGKEFGISRDSEIVKYCADGYMSYTFHIKDSAANIAPYFIVNFTCDKSFYDEHIDLFDAFRNKPYGNNGNSVFVNDQVPLYSEAEKAADKIYELLERDILYVKANYTSVSFYNNLSEENMYDLFDEFCEKYKTAKMAYLDKNGNIISISNQTSIYKSDIFSRTPLLKLSLEDNVFTSSFSYGPPWFIIPIVIGVLTIILVFVIPITIIVAKAKKRKQITNL